MKLFGKGKNSSLDLKEARRQAALAIERLENAARNGRDISEVQQLFNNASEMVERLANSGDDWAQCRMGFLCKSFLHDFSKAAFWYAKSAAQGNAEAQCKLGYLYRNGRGVPQDDKEAARLYRASAESGYAEGQHNWAVMNMEGSDTVPQNLSVAFRWFNLAADQGYDDSQFNLGNIYFWGNEVIMQDLEKAEYWFTLAAGQGHEGAMHNLAILDFATGLGAKHIVKRSPS